MEMTSWTCDKCHGDIHTCTHKNDGPHSGPYSKHKGAGTSKRQIDILYQMARLLRNTDGLFPSVQGDRAGKLLIELRALDMDRYNAEVMMQVN